MLVLLLTTDLMLPSQLAGVAAQAGVRLAVVASPATLQAAAAEGGVALVLLDLNLRELKLSELVPALRALNPPPAVVAYGPHVQETLLASARAAGCNEVLARGQVHRGFADLLAKYVNGLGDGST